ncbi:MAG: ribosome biogenesis GTPase Der [Porticoccaceae bacterium]|nr:ribosome biogenesis GTPase Der [Porticoccaceae bacterium]
MLPVIALVGRPNVGKSTLFNRLTRSRDALVANYAGLTRDRKYGDGVWQDRRFVVVDTGGITGEEEGIDSVMAAQSLQAMEEAAIVLFLVDCRDGLTATDEAIAKHLRETGKTCLLVANKIDGLDPNLALADFYRMGFENIYPTTATHGRGVSNLMDSVLALFPPQPEEAVSDDETERGIKIAIVGRPNVGKSTLVNRMLGEQRVVVYDQPGTTRDSIYIDYERNGKKYTLIDTAGVRKRKNISLTVEKFSIVKTLQAIDDANVVILLMDGSEGIVDQDLHLMGYAIDAGRALVVAINKWDGLDLDQKNTIKTQLQRRLEFVRFADIHFISALHGTGVGDLYKSVHKAYASATDKLSTNVLTRILEDAIADHPPPMVKGRRIKLRYAHAGGRNPPLIIIHGTQTDAVPDHFTRYLEKTFRKALDLHGTPIRIEYKSSDNPYAGRKNTLTPRQIAKRRRLMKHAKGKK